MNQSLDDVKGGTWNATRVDVRDKVGNSQSKEIDAGGNGSPLEGMTFDLDTATENASDKSAPVLSSLAATVSADGDGTFSVVFSGSATDDSSIEYIRARFDSTTDNSEIYLYAWSYQISGGSFTSSSYDLDSLTNGKYILSNIYVRDNSGNEKEVRIEDGGTASPIEDLSFNYAAVPTDISFTESTINEETLGASLGEVKVNGVANNGLYTITITGADASSLEISSKGYLRLKDNVKLDYENDTTLEFTLTAENGTGDSYSENFTINVIDNGLVGSSLSNAGFVGIDIDSENLIGNPSNDISTASAVDSEIIANHKEADLLELGIKLETYEEEIETTVDLYNPSNEDDNSSELEEYLESNSHNQTENLENLPSSYVLDFEDEDLLISNDII